MKRLFTVLTALVLAVSLRAETETFKIDPVHSSIGFSLRHLFSKYSSNFTKVTGAIVYDAAEPEKSSVEATVDIGSLNTANPDRDKHLKSPDFFDEAKFATATFKSKSWVKTGEGTFDVTGDLTIKGVTKETVLQVTLLGTGPGMGGSTVSGWEAAAKIKRTDFGVSYGPKILGEEVTLNISIEAGYKK
ncbi:MAG: polyisoprenoid-binding protein [Opitutae bacterium]|nr:polyisoprenoid-binding protein [Opitutae bacterium]